MRVLQNTAVSSPDAEFLVAFSVSDHPIGAAVRRTVVVLAQTPAHAKRICRQRYPRGLHLQVFRRVPSAPEIFAD